MVGDSWWTSSPLNLVRCFLRQNLGFLIVWNVNRNLQLLATESNRSCVLEWVSVSQENSPVQTFFRISVASFSLSLVMSHWKQTAVIYRCSVSCDLIDPWIQDQHQISFLPFPTIAWIKYLWWGLLYYWFRRSRYCYFLVLETSFTICNSLARCLETRPLHLLLKWPVRF